MSPSNEPIQIHVNLARNYTRFNMDVQFAGFFLKEGKRSRNCNGETYIWTLLLPILSVSLCVWSGGSTHHHHSIPPILLWLVGQGDPTQLRAPQEHLPRHLPWHRQWRPQVGAPPLFPSTSSTHSRTWWTTGRFRCQSHGSDWTQVCWRFGWCDTSFLAI